ncbi:MAG: hypothetical protein BWY89_01711 [Bacteroidetes bacterium ADurb.BinA012]|nr:MAG: hypothetical protein BWY89_01711 [Bacteroidetes bacterium ADurb.BinA012]
MPTHSRMSATRTGMETCPRALARGADPASANPVPILALAISSPIARASSLPLNHFTIIFETVIPAVSTPTPNIA